MELNEAILTPHIDLQSAKIPRGHGAALSDLLEHFKKRRGWSNERLAEEATARLWDEASGIEISVKQIETLMSTPRRPMSTYLSRAVLAAVVDALGADRALVNRLAGGI